MNRLWLFVTSLVFGLALALGGGWWWLNRNYQFQGVLIDPPARAADFTLTDQNGKPFRLSDQRGKTVLIYFGYTNCPDVCPITMTDYKRIKTGLGSQADKVQFVFITVDPERDTNERLKAYLANFDSSIIGLTADQATLEPVWKAYGVYQQKQDEGSAAGYLVDHTSRIYVIDPDGNWRINYPFGMETSKIVQDLEHIIR
jgi:protein SCO1